MLIYLYGGFRYLRGGLNVHIFVGVWMFKCLYGREGSIRRMADAVRGIKMRGKRYFWWGDLGMNQE